MVDFPMNRLKFALHFALSSFHDQIERAGAPLSPEPGPNTPESTGVAVIGEALGVSQWCAGGLSGGMSASGGSSEVVPRSWE